MGVWCGVTTLPSKKKIVEKPPRNSAGFCGGGQGLSWAVEPRKERRKKERKKQRSKEERKKQTKKAGWINVVNKWAPDYEISGQFPTAEFRLHGSDA
jgi:hypothetical protein